MKSTTMANGLARRALAAFGLAAILAAASSADDAKPMLLKLKAQPGATWRNDFTYTMKMTRVPDGNPNDKSQMEVKLELSVVTKVTSVRKDGRMTLQQKLSRGAQQMSSDGEVLYSFDSARPGELDKMRKDPTYAALIAAMDSSWKVVMEPTGEVLDREITVPGGDANPALKMAVTGFLDGVTAQTNFILPVEAVKPGGDWVSGPFDRAMPGIGRLKGETKGTFSAVHQDDGDSVAVILVKRTAKLEPDADSGVAAEMTEFEEGGALILAPERGRFKSMSFKGTIAYKIKSERGAFTVRSTSELEVREGKP